MHISEGELAAFLFNVLVNKSFDNGILYFHCNSDSDLYEYVFEIGSLLYDEIDESKLPLKSADMYVKIYSDAYCSNLVYYALHELPCNGRLNEQVKSCIETNLINFEPRLIYFKALFTYSFGYFFRFLNQGEIVDQIFNDKSFIKPVSQMNDVDQIEIWDYTKLKWKCF